MSGLSLGLLVIVAYAHALHLTNFNTSSRVRREAFELQLEWEVIQNDLMTFYGWILFDGEPFNVQFDTMGDISWVPSKRAEDPMWRAKCGFEIAERPAELPKFWTSVPGGKVEGYVLRRELEIGDMYIPGFSFGAAHKFPPSFMLPGRVDGKCGLARTMIHPSVTATLLEAIYGVQKGFEKKFSIKLCPPEDQIRGSGLITFGGVSTESSEEQTTYIPLNKEHFWTFTITKITYPSVRTEVAPMRVIMNSAGEFITGPKQFTELINKHLQSHSGSGDIYDVNCTERVHFPTVVFHADSVKIELDYRKYIIMRPDGTCYSAFRGSGDNTRTWVFGMPAHRYSVVTYDEDNNRIKFADAQCP